MSKQREYLIEYKSIESTDDDSEYIAYVETIIKKESSNNDTLIDMEITDNANFKQNLKIGACLVFVAQLLFSLNNIIIKISSLPISQLLFCRFLTQFILASICWIYKKPININKIYGDTKQISFCIIARGIFECCGKIAAWFGISRLPIGDATCIHSQVPTITVLFAVLFLKERMTKLTIVILVLAIIGITILSQPSFLVNVLDQNSNPLNVPGLMSLCVAVILFSFGNILVRKAGHNAHFLQFEIMTSGCSVFVILPLLVMINEYIFEDDGIGTFSDWIFTEDLKSILYMVLIGIFSFVGQTMIVTGFQCAEATKVAPIEYTIIIFGFVYQVFIFNQIPNVLEIIGASIITFACILSAFISFGRI